jgi:uncharacterized lipoprotein NlpE involved in copper resistance
MSSSFDTTARRIARATIAVSVAILVMGCAKKESKEAAADKAMPTEEPSVATMPADISGTYTTETSAGDAGDRTVSLTLNADHTASMSTMQANDESPMMQEGTWTENGESMVDVTFVSDTGDTTMMSFHVGGTELHMMGSMGEGMGMTLMKEGSMTESEEHQH